MTRPKRIRILGKLWSVFWPEKLSPHDDDAGKCEQSEQSIHVITRIHLEQQQDTLWHEITHAIEKELDLNLSESTVRLLATAQLAVLKDNASVRAFLMRKT